MEFDRSFTHACADDDSWLFWCSPKLLCLRVSTVNFSSANRSRCSRSSSGGLLTARDFSLSLFFVVFSLQ